MTFEDIMQEWSLDANLNSDRLDEEALKIPQLHAKYYKFYVTEKMKLYKLKEDRKRLILDKNDYYRGIMPREEVIRRGWEIWNLTVLKTEMQTYIDADKHVSELNMKIALAQEKVDFLESIIKSLTNRGYQIKSAIDFIRFREGA